MESYNVFNSFIDSFLESIDIIESSEYNRYAKKRKINEISYATKEEDIINDDTEDEYVENKDNFKMRLCTCKKWKIKMKNLMV